jgi:hypothetical protein
VLRQDPIADPAQYEVVYRADGALEVKADCNRAYGEYTYDGGMVGSVCVEMHRRPGAALPGNAALSSCGFAVRRPIVSPQALAFHRLLC